MENNSQSLLKCLILILIGLLAIQQFIKILPQNSNNNTQQNIRQDQQDFETEKDEISDFLTYLKSINQEDDLETVEEIKRKEFKSIILLTAQNTQYFTSTWPMNDFFNHLCLTSTCKYDIVRVQYEDNVLMNIWDNPIQYFGRSFGITKEEILKNIQLLYHKKGSLLFLQFYYNSDTFLESANKIIQFLNKNPYFDGISINLGGYLDFNNFKQFHEIIIQNLGKNYLISYKISTFGAEYFSLIHTLIDTIYFIEAESFSTKSFQEMFVKCGSNCLSYEEVLSMLYIPSQKLIPIINNYQNPENIGYYFKQAKEQLNITPGGVSIKIDDEMVKYKTYVKFIVKEKNSKDN